MSHLLTTPETRPLCCYCETEPADMILPNQERPDDPIPICQDCLNGIFERTMKEDFEVSEGAA